MNYLVLHSHPEGLVFSEHVKSIWRERFPSLLGVVECPTFSLQKEYVKYDERPLTLILCNMSDRYQLAATMGVSVIETDKRSAIWTILETGKLPVYMMIDPETGEFKPI